jgi:surface protein
MLKVCTCPCVTLHSETKLPRTFETKPHVLLARFSLFLNCSTARIHPHVATVALRTENLQDAVNLWITNEAEATGEYGEISTWDVSTVTDMTSLFSSKGTFNADISDWDVSSVTSMKGLFHYATAFN